MKSEDLVSKVSSDFLNKLIYLKVQPSVKGIRYKDDGLSATIKSEFYGFSMVESYEDFEQEALLILYETIKDYVKLSIFYNEMPNLEGLKQYLNRTVYDKSKGRYVKIYSLKLRQYKRNRRKGYYNELELLEDAEWLLNQRSGSYKVSNFLQWFATNRKDLLTAKQQEALVNYFNRFSGSSKKISDVDAHRMQRLRKKVETKYKEQVDCKDDFNERVEGNSKGV